MNNFFIFLHPTGRILINRYTDLIRQQKRLVSIEEAEESAGTLAESDYEFYELLKELPESDRTLFLLYYGEGFSIREIAEIPEWTENTAKSRIQRGRERRNYFYNLSPHEYVPVDEEEAQKLIGKGSMDAPVEKQLGEHTLRIENMVYDQNRALIRFSLEREYRKQQLCIGDRNLV